MKLLTFLYASRGLRWMILLVILASAISGLASISLIGMISRSLATQGTVIPGMIWGYFGLCLLLPLSRMISQLSLAYLSESAVYEMRDTLVRQILATPLRRLEEIGSSTLLATLTADVGAITAAYSNLPFFVMQLVIVIGGLGYLAWLAWAPFLIFLGILALAIVTIQLSEYPAKKFLNSAREETDRLYDHLRSLTEALKELKLHRQRSQTFLDDVLGRTAKAMRRYNIKGAGIFAVSRGWAQLLFFAVMGAVIFGLPKLTAMQSEVITGYALTILYLSFPLDFLMGLFPVMSYAHICIGKIDSMKFSLAIPHQPYDPSLEPPPDKAWASLELIGATHCYQVENQSSSFLLGPLDLCIYPGELIFITGGNGSGKTTLVKLLTGLYPPESGEIRFNDQIITEKNRDHYRQYFTATFSDFHLFDRLLGMEAADLDQQARSYLVKLHLDSKVQVQGGVFSTLDLSYGQRKRLALLTAFLEDRPIYVFDEWAADQDPQFREKFYYELLPELKSRGKTVIVITHDDRYYSVADRIIKLDYGKIAFDHEWPVVEGLMRSAVSNLSR